MFIDLRLVCYRNGQVCIRLQINLQSVNRNYRNLNYHEKRKRFIIVYKDNTMFTIHEGDVVFKEKYGSSDKSRIYVKPPDQINIVKLDEDNASDYKTLFAKIFLPQGYPESVSGDYLNYQIWDTAQAFCSTVTGILATKEVLRGVGVGDTNATPVAATVVWVIKDGCGHLGRILFAYKQGALLDAYSKKWRLYADTLNDAAMCMEIALPLFKNFTTPVLCVSTVMKAIVGVAGGATRAAMTQHHAIRGNMADVSAKDSAQETAVNLIGSLAALLIINFFGNPIIYIIFLWMIVQHIIFNYFAVRAVCLRTLNEPRFIQLIEAYLKEEIIAAPCEINRNEPIILYQLGSNILDLKLSGFRIRIGNSIANFIKFKQQASYLKTIQKIYEDRDYLLLPDLRKKTIYVALKETANTYDILCSYFHAVLLAIAICAINDYPLSVYTSNKTKSRPFAQICLTIQKAQWSRDETTETTATFSQCPSIDLMSYLDKIVEREWPKVANGLSIIGWDINKHLLVVDEWRMCNAKIVTRAISMDPTSASLLKQLSSKVITFHDMDVSLSDVDEIKDTYIIEPEPEHIPATAVNQTTLTA